MRESRVDTAAAVGLLVFTLVYFGAAALQSYVEVYGPELVATAEQRQTSFFMALVNQSLFTLLAVGSHALGLAWVRRHFRPLRLGSLVAMEALVGAMSVAVSLLGRLVSGWLAFVVILVAPANVTLLAYAVLDALHSARRSPLGSK
jgi:hypothetical protein